MDGLRESGDSMRSEKHLTKLKLVFGFGVVLTGLGLLFTNCSGYESKSHSNGYTSVGSGGSGGPGEPLAGTVTFSTDTPVVISELGKSHTVNLIIKTKNYLDDVEVKIARPELDELDLMGGVVISAPTGAVDLPATGVLSVPIVVNVTTLAPTITDEHFHIEVYKANSQLLIDEVEVHLNVKAIFRLQVFGTGDANWKVDGVSLAVLFNNRANGDPTFNFVHHNLGLQIILENYSSANRRFHSSGAIPHQGVGGTAPSPDGGLTVGGSYVPAAIVGNQLSNAIVYLHDDENGNLGRRLNFNVDL